MKQVKLFIAEDCYTDCYGDGPSTSVIREGVTDWEEISDDDYELLRSNLHRLVNRYGGQQQVVLIEKDTVPVKERISSIKQWIADERARLEQEAAKRKAAAEEKALKRMLKKAGDEKRLLEELKKKYPDAV